MNRYQPPETEGGISRRRALLGATAYSVMASVGVPRKMRRGVHEFGVISHPSADQQQGLQRALDWCNETGGVLLFRPNHIYCHSGMLELRRGALQGAGAMLMATQPNAGCLRVSGNGVVIDHLVLGSRAFKRTQRYSGVGLLVEGAREFRGTRLIVRGAAAAGVLLDNSHHCFLTDVQVFDTMADGLHITNNSSYIEVRKYKAVRPGDDGLAIVSYDRKDRPPLVCHNICARDILVVDGKARGIAIVGGNHVSIEGVEVVRSACAGVYINSEISYGTFGNYQCSFKSARLIGCVTRAGINQGVIHVEGRTHCNVPRDESSVESCSSRRISIHRFLIAGCGVGARAGVVVAGAVSKVSIEGRGGKLMIPARIIDDNGAAGAEVNVSVTN